MVLSIVKSDVETRQEGTLQWDLASLCVWGRTTSWYDQIDSIIYTGMGYAQGAIGRLSEKSTKSKVIRGKKVMSRMKAKTVFYAPIKAF